MSIFVVVIYLHYEAYFEIVTVTTRREDAVDAAQNPKKYGATMHYDSARLEEWNALTGVKITECVYR